MVTRLQEVHVISVYWITPIKQKVKKYDVTGSMDCM